jgi:hypothetical protein
VFRNCGVPATVNTTGVCVVPRPVVDSSNVGGFASGCALMTKYDVPVVNGATAVSKIPVSPFCTSPCPGLVMVIVELPEVMEQFASAGTRAHVPHWLALTL